jgi:peptide deformylase
MTAGKGSSRIFQHETDHLNGGLYIDHLDDEGRRTVMADLRRLELEIPEPKKRRLLRRGEA